jgi:predicted DNA-binding protein (MmcQ/YjbR family)
MTRTFVNDLCAALPGAEHSDPWGGGHDAWKVGGKMFAVVGAVDEAVSIKCRDIETARLLIDLGRAERAPYFHRSWVRIPLGAGSTVQQDELAERLMASYRLIREALPKKLQAELGEAAGPHETPMIAEGNRAGRRMHPKRRRT